jgi:hypothetical protein
LREVRINGKLVEQPATAFAGLEKEIEKLTFADLRQDPFKLSKFAGQAE